MKFIPKSIKNKIYSRPCNVEWKKRMKTQSYNGAWYDVQCTPHERGVVCTYILHNNRVDTPRTLADLHRCASRELSHMLRNASQQDKHYINNHFSIDWITDHEVLIREIQEDTFDWTVL